MAKKKMKLWKKILIAILAVIVALAAAAYCVFNFYIKPKYSEKIMNAVSLIMEDDELMSEITEVIEDEQFQAEINAALSDDQMQAELGAAIAEAIPQPESQAEQSKPTDGAKDAPAPQTAEPQPQTVANTAAPSAPVETEKPAKKSKSMMEVAKENVSPQDFATGMKMAGKIDVSYILGLSKDGFTAEEKAEAKAHLKSRLSKTEIAKLKSLIAKYSYLLN